MGLLDAIKLHQAKVTLSRAEEMEKAGHFGPAMRLYKIASNQFFHAGYTGNVGDFSERCRTAALQRGEDPEIAPTALDQYDNTAALLGWYYEQQVVSLENHLKNLTSREDWNGLLDLAQAARHLPSEFLSKAAAKGVRYTCLYYTGRAHVGMGSFGPAIAALTEVYNYSHRESLPEGTAWAALYLGEAYALSDNQLAEKFLPEAAAFGEFRYRPEESDSNAIGKQAFRATELLDEYFNRQLDRLAYPDVVDLANRAARHTSLNAATRAERILKAYGQLVDAWQQDRDGRFDQAAALSESAARLAATERCASIEAEAAAFHREVLLKDPAMLPVHGQTIRSHLDKDEFGPADELLAELAKRHAQAPAVEQMRQGILRAKREYADRGVSEASRLLERQALEQAEETITRARAMADSVGYEPPQYVAVRAPLSESCAAALGLAAEGKSADGLFADALSLTAQAAILPLLSESTKAKLVALDEKIIQDREGEAGRCRRDIRNLVERESFEEATARIEIARKQGYAELMAEEETLVTDCIKVRGILEGARKDLDEKKFKESLAKVQEGWAIRSCPSLRGKLREVHSSIEQWMNIIRTNYEKSEDSPSVAVGLGLAGAAGVFFLLWKAVHHQLLLSLWNAFVAYLALSGGVVVLIRRKPYIHDGETHSLSMAVGALVVFGATVIDRATGTGPWAAWLGGLIVGFVAGAIVHWILGWHCPAQKPIDVPPLLESEFDDWGSVMGVDGLMAIPLKELPGSRIFAVDGGSSLAKESTRNS